MKLIDKDALVAEIEKMVSNGKAKCQLSIELNDHESYVAWSEHIATCGKILSFLSTLEAKEVDLEKEIETHLKECLDVKFPTTDIELIKKDVDIENAALTEWNDYIKKMDGEPDYAYMLFKRDDYIALAKRFYELGIKSQKEEYYETD